MDILGGKTQVLMVITVLLLTIVLTTVVTEPWTDDSVVMDTGMDEAEAHPEEIDLYEIQEDVVRGLFDDNGKMVTSDERLASVARDHEGGFGGFYFHETDENIAYVYMKDVSKVEAAKAAFRAAYTGGRDITHIIPVQGDYSFDDLVQWFYALDKALVANDIHPSTGSVREIDNRIQFGLPDSSQFDDARRVMRGRGIPYGAVNLVEQDYPTFE